jgi:aryl-alcohol dehydrogenase-like predicted oxidoreductase
MGIVPWSPLKSGLLSGRYTRDEPAPADTKRAAAFGRRPSEADFDVIDVVVAIAEELGATPGAVALSWCRVVQASPPP